MLIVTSNEIPGHRIDAVFGEVMGLTVRARDIGAQFVAGLRSLGGGELPEMTRALYESRQQVMARMVTEAEQRGAERHRCHALRHLRARGQSIYLTAPAKPQPE